MHNKMDIYCGDLARATRYMVLCIGMIVTALSGAAAAKEAEPNFSGVWYSQQNLNRESDKATEGPDALFRQTIDEHVPADGGPKLREPYRTQKQQADAIKAEKLKQDKILMDTEIQCRPDGMPKMMRGILPIEILQMPNKVVIIAEELSLVRRIFIDKMPPSNEITPSYAGYSAGHWEGKTLIVRTVQIRPEISFADIPNSGKSEIAEEFRLIDKDHLEIKFTYKDDSVLEEPYTFTWTYERHDEHKIMEYICDNNKYSLNPDGTVQFNIDD